MKKLMVVVLGFGVFSVSVASAAVAPVNGLALAVGEKSASQMNGRMLACGSPARMVKSADRESTPVARQSQAKASSAAIAR
ncbi:MAG: hypothetical protein RJB38_2179 [Pseudomonadota bacterium]|jgi:hypothetical protein